MSLTKFEGRARCIRGKMGVDNIWLETRKYGV